MSGFPPRPQLPIPLVELLRSMYRKLRPVIVALFVIALGFTPLIENQFVKMGTLISLLTMIVFLIFDASSTVDTRLKLIESGLSAIKQGGPPQFSDFQNAREHIKGSIANILANHKDIHIQVLALAAFYSTEFLKKSLRDLISGTRGKIRIEIAVTCEKTLESHSQDHWLAKLRMTKGNIDSMQSDFRDEIAKGKLVIDFFEYDNLPHWHGMLINGQIFYMGRTEWDYTSKDSDPVLQLGQIEYRFFSLTDSFGGLERIERFVNWFAYYRRRSEKLRH